MAIMENYTRQTAQAVAVQDNPEARELLRRAFDRTSRWRADFVGFRAALIVNDNGVEHRGTVQVTMPRAIDVTVAEPELQQWAQQQLAMMAGHRGYRAFDQADGKYTLTLGPEEAHPLGRLVYIHGDGMNSRYRVKDERICQIQRSMERVQFTINIEDTMTTRDDKVLTTRFTVYYFDPSTGQLTQVESFTDDYCEVGGIVLPKARRVSFADHGEARVREVVLSEHAVQVP
jgi:hypothetical protein